MQALGEDIHRILAGRKCGPICRWDCLELLEVPGALEDPDELPICWSLGNHVPVEVISLIAMAKLVVIGLADGALRVLRP